MRKTLRQRNKRNKRRTFRKKGGLIPPQVDVKKSIRQYDREYYDAAGDWMKNNLNDEIYTKVNKSNDKLKSNIQDELQIYLRLKYNWEFGCKLYSCTLDDLYKGIIKKKDEIIKYYILRDYNNCSFMNCPKYDTSGKSEQEIFVFIMSKKIVRNFENLYTNFQL